jgi:subtilisin family serine protease
MRRALLLLAGALVAWAAIERVRGPRAEPLPSGLPHVTRTPPPLRAAFPAAQSGVNPGPDIRALHARGITGRGVGIAIIDRPLLTTHREFAGRLRWYDEADTDPAEPAGWHSTAVASIAAGATVGVAPEADIYFVGVGMIWNREPLGNWFVAARRALHTGQTLPLAIHRILELNRQLPEGRKIRVISISVGGGSELFSAIAEARRAGLFVSALDLHLKPLGFATFASPTAPDAYTTHATPAGSWAIAHLAGRYALACQQDPTMTPGRFRAILN